MFKKLLLLIVTLAVITSCSKSPSPTRADGWKAMAKVRMYWYNYPKQLRGDFELFEEFENFMYKQSTDARKLTEDGASEWIVKFGMKSSKDSIRFFMFWFNGLVSPNFHAYLTAIGNANKFDNDEYEDIRGYNLGEARTTRLTFYLRKELNITHKQLIKKGGVSYDTNMVWEKYDFRATNNK